MQPTLLIAQDAVVYLEELITQLLFLICSSFPRSIQDVEERVQRTFPPQINEWAINLAKSTIDKGKKKSLTLPLDKIHPFICKVLKSLFYFRVGLKSCSNLLSHNGVDCFMDLSPKRFPIPCHPVLKLHHHHHSLLHLSIALLCVLSLVSLPPPFAVTRWEIFQN